MARDKYEISLWEDYLVDETTVDDVVIPQHYEERKIAVIGSDSITASCRAIEPRLVENINGTNTFTFKMFYVCKNDTIEDLIYQFQTSQGEDLSDSNSLQLIWRNLVFNNDTYQNPFLNLLVNERKVKVKWKGKWYDLVIKNCQEDSSGKSIIYTCKDLYINELSKTGFELVLDTELGNNQGTVTELAQTVLEDTDWQLNAVNDIVQQKKEEPVYEATLLRDIVVDNETTSTPSETIPSGEKVLFFYEQIQSILNDSNTSGSGYLQLAYSDNFKTDTNSQLVINSNCYSFSTVQWRKSTYDGVACIEVGPSSGVYCRIFYLAGVSNDYRASRLVRSQKCVLDPLTKKYCYVYKATADGTGTYSGLISNGDEIYAYRSTEYKDPTFVNNIVVNSKDFTSTEGWIGENLTFQLYPKYETTSDITTYSAFSYLHLIGAQNFFNNGIRQLSNFLPNGFSIGEKFIFRIKARGNSGSSPSSSYVTNYNVTPKICQYTDSSSGRAPVSGTDYFTSSAKTINGQWVEYTLTCTKTATRADIYNNRIGLFIVSGSSLNIWAQEVQLFPLYYGLKNNASTRLNPGEMDIESVAEVYYTYYNHTKSEGLISEDDVKNLYRGTTDLNLSYLQAQYNENFEKIRSISAKQSNRFNILQSIAETFECWVRFDIEHDENTGRTIYRNGIPQKFVTFKNEIGRETGVGFIYGIDLKTIQRTIQSDQIVTKTIVGTNSNEFGIDGFCTIARSEENYPRTNFILNFDYYVTQGLLNGGELNRDLYLSTDSIGYYYWLNKYNVEYDSLIEIINEKQTELLKQKSYLTIYDSTITSLTEQIQNLKDELIRLASAGTWAGAQSYIKAHSSAEQVNNRMIAIATLQKQLDSYILMRNELQSSVNSLTNFIETKTDRQDELLTLIKAKHFEFYKKYSRFIQEGSWISEDYLDDNLYYLDGLSVAYTSSRPQISYNVSVLRLSALEEFKNKVFLLGDISFIQDTEFFGYTYINGVKTPYKEKVLVSEITSNFDEPQKDLLKIQNYKTQFEDLFQRITSTTQSLQYASGEYARAASVVETNGTINPETLQASITRNEQFVYSAKNESVISDSTGLTVSDTTDPNKKTKVTSGGIFITTDGGVTWKNAVRGEGVATQYLTTGSINTSLINVMDGNFATFRWDETGINAYDQNPRTGINLSKFVRFDHYGVYGYEGNNEFAPESETDIWDNGKFGLTWKGFFVKNKYANHYVEVSSANDIQVVDTSNASNPIARVKIGKLDDGIYGLRLKDGTGATTMETADDGTLWLRNALNISRSSSDYNIQLGYLSGVKSGTTIHEVFNATNKFIVYEDGTIHATGGTIGNMTIAEVEQSTYKVNILTDSGTIFKNGEGTKVLTAQLVRGNTVVTSGTFSYVWKCNGTVVSGATSSTLQVSATAADSTYNYECDVTYTPPSI